MGTEITLRLHKYIQATVLALVECAKGASYAIQH